jgi:hypothetical protein
VSRAKKLATLLAREIFKCGDERPQHGGPCQRIQFMCGKYPDKEIAGGGLCESALADLLVVILDTELEKPL